ncbi:hypothetical protein [Okeania sp. SIO1I7]|nr:hypothetical protein [Okeania sp. SIO1I7]
MIEEGRRKKKEGRRQKAEGRRQKAEGRRFFPIASLILYTLRCYRT